MDTNLSQGRTSSSKLTDKQNPPAKANLTGSNLPGIANSSSIPPPKKEKELTGSLFKEAEPKVIEKKEFEAPAEVKEWVKEIKGAEEITLPQPIKDEYGQLLVEAAAPIKPKIVLPLTKPKIQQALKKKIIESIRWLAEWCLRLIKMFPKRINYGSNN